MGTYYGATQVEKLGTRKSDASSTPVAVAGDRRAVAVLDNGLYKIAADVSDPSEYKAFHDSYSQGMWLTFKVYTLTTQELELCPDEGRVSSRS